MISVYVYQRNGERWADISAPSKGIKLEKVIEVRTSAEANTRAAKEEGRVAAVLSRVASSLLAIEQSQSRGKELPLKSSFAGRMKWLFTGK